MSPITLKCIESISLSLSLFFLFIYLSIIIYLSLFVSHSSFIIYISRGIYCPNCGLDDHHVEYLKPTKSRASTIIAPLNPCQAPKYDAYIKFPMLLRNMDIVVGEKENKIRYFQSLLRSAGNSELVQSWFPLLCRSNIRVGAEQAERRSTMGHVKENSRNGSNNFDLMNSNSGPAYSKINSSEIRRESYGGSNYNNNNNYNNDDNNYNYNNSSSSRSKFKDKNDTGYHKSSDNLDIVNVSGNSNNMESNRRKSNNFGNSNGKNYSHNNNNNNNGNGNSHSIGRVELSRHDHLSGEGRPYHHEQQVISRSSKWKADSDYLENRTVVNSRAVFNNSASHTRRSSHSSYDSNEYIENGKDRDSGRTTRRY